MKEDSTCEPVGFKPSGSLSFMWWEIHDKALNNLQEALCNPLTLAFSNFILPFILYMDASHDGFAPCLDQPFSSDHLPISHVLHNLFGNHIFTSRNQTDRS